jgi:hypothetical protein
MPAAILVLIMCPLLLAAPSPNFGSVSATWFYDYTQPGASDVIRFTIYYGQNQANLTNTVSIPTSAANPATNTVIGNLNRNSTYYFSITPSTAFAEGDYSSIMSATIPAKPPKVTSTAAN